MQRPELYSAGDLVILFRDAACRVQGMLHRQNDLLKAKRGVVLIFKLCDSVDPPLFGVQLRLQVVTRLVLPVAGTWFTRLGPGAFTDGALIVDRDINGIGERPFR